MSLLASRDIAWLGGSSLTQHICCVSGCKRKPQGTFALPRSAESGYVASGEVAAWRTPDFCGGRRGGHNLARNRAHRRAERDRRPVSMAERVRGRAQGSPLL